MVFVDTHCHLNFESYQPDLELVIKRAFEQGVNRIIVPGLDLYSSQEAVTLSDRFDCVFAAIGIHPSHSDSYNSAQILEFEKLAQHPKVVGIGEIGLDFYHPHDKQGQITLLRDMLDLAEKLKKPVILHSRNSLPELMETVFQKSITGVFHAFEGNSEDAKDIISHHYLLGASGPITYKNALDKQEVFSKIEIQGIVLETDGPFLPPEKFRGSRNEPGRIPIIAQKIADLRKCSIDEVASQTTENARKLFKWVN